MSVKAKLGRKAATSVAKHTVHGTVSKAKREPVRASRLLAAGALLGLVAGFIGGRAAGRRAVAPPAAPAVAFVPPATAAAPAAPSTPAFPGGLDREAVTPPGEPA